MLLLLLPLLLLGLPKTIKMQSKECLTLVHQQTAVCWKRKVDGQGSCWWTRKVDGQGSCWWTMKVDGQGSYKYTCTVQELPHIIESTFVLMAKSLQDTAI